MSTAPAAPAVADEAQEEEEHDPSALDLLAQASQLEVAQGDSPEAEPASEVVSALVPTAPATSTTSNLTPRPPSSNTLEPAIDLHPSSNTPRASLHHLADSSHAIDLAPRDLQDEKPLLTPLTRPRNLSNASELQTPAQRLIYPPDFPSPSPFDETPHHTHGHPQSTPFTYGYGHGPSVTDTSPGAGAFASPTGATVPGLGKYVHLSSSMPARRVRSPYLKWTVEEVCLSQFALKGR